MRPIPAADSPTPARPARRVHRLLMAVGLVLGALAMLMLPAASRADIGTTWFGQTPVDNYYQWRAVTYANDRFVALAQNGSDYEVGMTSLDGKTWDESDADVDNDGRWNSIAYGAGKFVAVAYDGWLRPNNTTIRVMTSPDGQYWTARYLPSPTLAMPWLSVAYGNGVFVAVKDNTTAGAYAMTSPDGVTWTRQNSAGDYTWRSITYGNNTFVAVGYSGSAGKVMTSPDGVTWTSQTSATITNNNWLSVTYGNGTFVAVSDTGTGGAVMTSTDGINWTPSTAAAGNRWMSVTYGNGMFVAVSTTGTGNRVMTSPDGVTWTSQASASDDDWRSVTAGAGIFVAVADAGTADRVMTSANAPGVPVITSAAPGDGQVTVTVAPGTTTGGPLTSYAVTAAPGGATCTIVPLANSCTFTGLTNGTPYSFVAVAQGIGGPSAASAPASATPSTLPGPPTNVTATPGDGRVVVAWTAPANDGGSAITGYTVTASPGGATCTATAPATTCTVTGLTNGTAYTFTVVARNANGNSVPSAASTAVSPRPGPVGPAVAKGTPTTTPTAIVVEVASVRAGTVTVTGSSRTRGRWVTRCVGRTTVPNATVTTAVACKLTPAARALLCAGPLRLRIVTRLSTPGRPAESTARIVRVAKRSCGAFPVVG